VKIPLVDLKAQYHSIRREIDGAIRRVIENGQFILGREVENFESEMAAYCQTMYAVGVGSGTDALHLALLACGIEPSDEVITTPFTFIATAEAVTRCGAIPVFVDIDPRTYNIEPTKIESKITRRTRAILPVHLYGQPADMRPILELGKKYSLKVVEDCAQALGAEHNGKRVGSIGDAGCLSFFPSKVLGAYGDGGMVVTNDPDIAKRVSVLRNHGCEEKYYYLMPGFSSRLDSFQAAILRVKLRHLDQWIEQRRQKAQLYSKLLSKIEDIELPYTAPYARHIFNYYTIRLKKPKVNRDKTREYLSSQSIETAIYYPLSLHLQEIYKSLAHKVGDFSESEQAQEEVLSLPIYAELSEIQVEEIVSVIKHSFLKR